MTIEKNDQTYISSGEEHSDALDNEAQDPLKAAYDEAKSRFRATKDPEVFAPRQRTGDLSWVENLSLEPQLTFPTRSTTRGALSPHTSSAAIPDGRVLYTNPYTGHLSSRNPHNGR
jgi:hypothetical protein